MKVVCQPEALCFKPLSALLFLFSFLVFQGVGPLLSFETKKCTDP
uniref:Uncharacterized protein n=1 Tax=Rhizophora mucronata TaxID=61149 RepID=A0A2P2NBH3_RHIMU